MAAVMPVPAGARVWDTNEVAPGEGFDYYHGAICQAFSHLLPIAEATTRRQFFARVATTPVGRGHINRVHATSHLVVRTEQEIARGDVDWYYLNYYCRGGCTVEQNGGAATIRTGDVGLFSGAEPFTIEHRRRPQLHVVSFMAPRQALVDRLGEDVPRTPHLISSHPLYGSLVREAARTLVETAATLPQPALDRLFETLFDFTCLALAPTGQEDQSGSRSRTLFLAMRAQIDRSARDAAFGIGHLATANRVSVRYVHKLFEAHGDGETFGDYLTRRRLTWAADRLCATGDRRDTVTDIAYEAGFSDLTQFYRAFHRRFGLAPGAYRQGRA